MSLLEIVLIIIGIVVVVVSFIIPEKLEEDKNAAVFVDEKQVQKVIDTQMEKANSDFKDSIDETVSYAVEKSERSLERISNEKMTAISEFSETVLSDIQKNHEEVMFLYEMLHDKQKNLHETVIQADKANASAMETKLELESAKRQLQEEEFAPMQLTDVSDDEVKVIEPVEPKKEKKPAKKAATKKATTKTSSTKKASAKKAVDEDVLSDVVLDFSTDSQEENNNQKILKMHKEGKSNVAIAKELGLGVGEVNLVIDLFEVM